MPFPQELFNQKSVVKNRKLGSGPYFIRSPTTVVCSDITSCHSESPFGRLPRTQREIFKHAACDSVEDLSGLRPFEMTNLWAAVRDDKFVATVWDDNKTGFEGSRGQGIELWSSEVKNRGQTSIFLLFCIITIFFKKTGV
jgi:hypothetical protein